MGNIPSYKDWSDVLEGRRIELWKIRLTDRILRFHMFIEWSTVNTVPIE